MPTNDDTPPEGSPKDPFDEAGDITEQSLVKVDQYQALFLSNGQVYFGRLWIFPKIDLYVLKDVFYFQNTAGDEGKKTQLTKLGNEMHGPEDAMQVRERHMLFWENLKPDSPVTVGIEKWKAT